MITSRPAPRDREGPADRAHIAPAPEAAPDRSPEATVPVQAAAVHPLRGRHPPGPSRSPRALRPQETPPARTVASGSRAAAIPAGSAPRRELPPAAPPDAHRAPHAVVAACRVRCAWARRCWSWCWW